MTRRTAMAVPLLAGAALALGPEPGVARASGRLVPARPLPVPDTVSPALQAVIARPLPQAWDWVPPDAAAWRMAAAATAKMAEPDIARIKERTGVRVTPDTIAGVPVFRIAPAAVAPGNEDRLFLHLHGGGYVFFPGEAGAGEGMLMAAQAGVAVVSVDYRMPPDHPFPAGLEDAAAVWQALAAERDPGRMAIFGTSAGGGLTFALMLKLKAGGLPLPAAAAAGSPWVDLTGAGDSLQSNAFVDNVLVSDTGWIQAAAKLYAAGRALTEPLVSPIFGDFTGLPPTIVTSGTRDLLLSDSVRAHRKLRQAGVAAALQVFEGQSHAQFLEPFVPETAEALGEIAAFLGQHLA